MTTSDLRRALLRSLSFHMSWKHAPTLPEWTLSIETGGGGADAFALQTAVRSCLDDGSVCERDGRFCLAGEEALIDEQRENELWAPRKRRRAHLVASYLARLSSVRFVALCNAAALGHARSDGDLDFFVITKPGTIMTTRGFATLPFKVLGLRPTPEDEKDAVCLSYFVTTERLDLTSHMLQPDDPYYRYWFLSLLPLFDDGIGEELWEANAAIRRYHPLARRWEIPPDFRVDVPRLRLPVSPAEEPVLRALQHAFFPPVIRARMNKGTEVVVTRETLKFHVEDGRERYRRMYEERCEKIGV